MREFEHLIAEEFIKGIRPNHNVPKNESYLYDCNGFVCGQAGLEAFEPATDVLTGMVSWADTTWPNPQMYTANRIAPTTTWPPNPSKMWAIFFTGNMLAHTYRVSSNWGVAAIQGDITNGETLSVADFDMYALVSLGSRMFHYGWTGTIHTWFEITTFSDFPRCGVITNFRGQLIGGDVRTTWHGCDRESIIWSDIGSVKSIPDRKNTAGFKVVNTGGVVRALKEIYTQDLGAGIIVYGDYGVELMLPIVDPSPSYGFRTIADVGVLNSMSIDGDTRSHVFIGKDSNLYSISSDIQVRKLGYREKLYDLVEPKVIRDNLTGYFWICDEHTTYILTQQGLTQVPQHPAILYRFEDSLYGYPDLIDEGYNTIITHVFDLGYRGNKTVFTIELGMEYLSGVQVAIDWRANHQDEFSRTAWVSINKECVANCIISGTEFRLCIRCTRDYNLSASISYAKVRYKMTDIRNMRGIYAPPMRGQGVQR